MKSLIHILGSDIPHHNQTILKFFTDELFQQLPQHRVSQFMIVANSNEYSDTLLKERFPQLQISVFPSKKKLAEAVIEAAQQDLTSEFFLHGQFNGPIWMALLTGKLIGKRFSWHIWGADLYEDAKGWKFKLFYLMRRYAQRKIGKVFATEGDRLYFMQRNPSINSARLYFPTKMDFTLTPSMPEKQGRSTRLLETEKPTVLLGNSGDKSNQHLRALTLVKQTFPQGANIIIPLGYPANNDLYIEEIKNHVDQRFEKENAGLFDITLLTTKLAFDEYLQLLSKCDIAYFLFDRQQGIGTISLCIQYGVPFVLSHKNPFSVDLKNEKIPYLLDDSTLTIEELVTAQKALAEFDLQSISFFSPNYLADWYAVLSEDTEVV